MSANTNIKQQKNEKIKFSKSVLPSSSSALYFVSLVGPSVLIGFFLLLSIFNQNLKGIAYLVGICVLFTVTSIFSGIFGTLTDSGNEKCGDHGLFSSYRGLPYGTLIYVFSFFYLILPMLTNGIVNIPMLVSLILITVLDASVNFHQGCTTLHFIILASVIASIFGTLWSLLIYSIKPELAYHTDYISSNKLACSLPSKQKFKCVVKKNGEIIG